jgi:hypothetical protein
VAEADPVQWSEVGVENEYVHRILLPSVLTGES